MTNHAKANHKFYRLYRMCKTNAENKVRCLTAVLVLVAPLCLNKLLTNAIIS